MTVHDIFRRVSPIFRRRRIAQFVQLFRPTAETRILDIGGFPNFWMGSSIESHITVLNLHPLDVPDNMRQRCVAVVGDGTALQFRDDEFDIVFSNSVIEHLFTSKRQQLFANEIRRVGRNYYVQTPAYEFFIEPHYLTPFVHWIPAPTRRKLVRNFSVWGLISRPSPAEVEAFVDEHRLLRFGEFQQLFPEAQILRERVLGMTKSYAAVAFEV